MTPNKYIKLTEVTDHEFYTEIQKRLSTEENSKLFHFMSGISTESGELTDVLKKTVIYGKPLDVVNIKEEIGDLLWYMARMLDYFDWTFEEVMELNISKLKARYGEKFTEKAALSRNLDKEREILENNTKVFSPNTDK